MLGTLAIITLYCICLTSITVLALCINNKLYDLVTRYDAPRPWPKKISQPMPEYGWGYRGTPYLIKTKHQLTLLAKIVAWLHKWL